MRGINKVLLIGNLGKEPEISYVEGGVCVAKFQLATTETYKDRGGKVQSQTEWHHIILWRGLAELAQKYLHKGSMVFIEGRLHTHSWEEKDGTRRFFTEVVGDNMIMLDKRNEGLHAGGSPASDDLPFLSTDIRPPSPTTDPDFLSF